MNALEALAAKLTPEQRFQLLTAAEQLKATKFISLDDFARRMLHVEPARHHRYMNQRLEALERGEIRRLMIFMPPGHAKSTYASWLFPAWYLGRRPKEKVLFVTNTGNLAASWGRKVRNLFDLPEWPFTVKLAQDKLGAQEWATADGGEYLSVGVGAAIAGRRADLAIIDDPLGGSEDADSELIRDKLWEYYKSDLHPRLRPDEHDPKVIGRVIIIQTRWHEDDLAGRILPEGYMGESGKIQGRDGFEWEVVCFPAFAEANDALGRSVGEPLWPEFINEVMLNAQRTLSLSTGSERNWAALYQQRPAPDEGAYFRREWFRWYEQAPSVDTLRIYGASDYAITAGGGDFTVHGVCGIDPDDNLYVLDWWRGQVDGAQGVDQWADMAKRWRPVQWGEDKAQIEKALGPFIQKRQKEMRVYCYRQGYPALAAKDIRAQSIRGRASQGKVYLPSREPWVTDLLSELLTFPSGRHDDQVDVMSLFGRMLTTMRPERVDRRLMPTRVNSSYSPQRWRAR